jgi:hypothetical protein
LFATPEALAAGKNAVPTALLVEGGGSSTNDALFA